jgi:hypothetical protein
MTTSEETGGTDAALAAVVAWINAARGTAYALRERFPVGTEGAWRVEDAAGGQFVLKFEPGALELAPLPAVLETLARLGRRGYPVPRYVAAGLHPRAPVGRFTLQERLPGDEAPRIDDALLDQILALNDLQAGMGLPETAPPEGWREHIIGPVLQDGAGPAGAKNADIRRHSPETAALLEALRDYVRAHADAPMGTRDVAHFDFSRGHVWTEILPHPDNPAWRRAGRITGIIDFEGLVTGDRAFDLVTALFYNTGPAHRAGPHGRLWDRACALAGPPTVGVYLAHIAHRQLGGCVRHHSADVIQRFLRTTREHLAGLSARTGFPFPE